MQKKDPPIYVTRPSLPPVEDYEALVREIFQSGYLTNGGAMHKRLEAALTEKLGVPVKLFVNGHHVGDAVLTILGQRLSRCLRKEDVLVRLGGDEFLALLSHRDRVPDIFRTVGAYAKPWARPFPPMACC